MQITIQTLKQHVPHKKVYSIMDTIKNHMVSTTPTAVAGAVIYSFDLDEAYEKFRELAVDANKNGRHKLFDDYWSFLELFNKMKDGA